jgi:hypothetical protein
VLKKCFLLYILILAVNVSITAQTHMSVPLENPIYVVLEQAQMRGLYTPIPNVKPYSTSRILSLIDEILNNDEKRRFGRLSEKERNILEQFQKDFSPDRDGINWTRGTFSFDHLWKDIYFSGQFGFGLDIVFSGSHFSSAGGYQWDGTETDIDDPGNGGFENASHPRAGDSFTSFEIMPKISFIGDIGSKVSYGLTLGIWAGSIPRTILGSHFNTLYTEREDPVGKNRRLQTTFSEPLTYFPYTHKKRWDGYVFPTSALNTSGMLAWPDGDLSLGYTMLPELAGSFLNGHVFFRFARLDREWAGMSANSSLVINQSAQPFLAFETVIQPFPWISFSSLTGVLEYHNAIGVKPMYGDGGAAIQTVSENFQNAYSVVMLELDIINHFYISFGSTVVWPKRFELGYPFPFADNFIYQANIGDWDNMALFLNLRAQYPGLGKLWFSLSIDEMSLERDFLTMSRMMYIYQIGGSFHIPWLPFSSVKVSYTKNEPYNYTHTRDDVPWYSSNVMEKNTVNFGRAIGHYIPPNSDELLVRFETIPLPGSLFSLQYQLIRHGATYGDRAVAGSTLWTELLHRRGNIYKHFLRDGAYQWMHIVRLRGEYSLTAMKLPIRAFAEIGGVYSYFTDIDSNIQPNSGRPSVYGRIDTPQYPRALRFIGSIGVQVFPKF